MCVFVMGMLQDRRQNALGQIIKFLRQTAEYNLTHKDAKNINFSMLTTEVSQQYGVSEATAIKYIQEAKNMCELDVRQMEKQEKEIRENYPEDKK